MEGKRAAFSFALVFTFALTLLCQAPAINSAPLASSTNLVTLKHTAKPATPAKPNRYEARYRRIWDYIDRNYLYHERLSNWEAWKHRYDGMLKSDADARAAISQMLQSLDDRYTYLRNPEETRRIYRESDEGHVVTSRMLDNGIGYIKLHSFASNKLIRQTRKALRKLSRASSLIIDVRDNGGGLVDVAFREFGLFMNEGTFTAYRGRPKLRTQNADLVLTLTDNEYVLDDRIEFEPREPDLSKGRPIVVLVNAKTRSAAEMFAGALRDHGRATIIGSTTFGKGILQDVCDLEDGSSVKVVTARYFLPRGENIHRSGITPDKSVSDNNPNVPLSIAVSTLRRPQTL